MTPSIDPSAVSRNDGIALDLDWLDSVRANTVAIERRAATLPGRRTVKRDHQAAWLVRAITCIDLTTLSGDDTEGRVKRLCHKAKQPLRQDLIHALGWGDASPTTAAVCVYHDMIEAARKSLEGSKVRVAAVSAGFPSGLSPYRLRVKEIESSVAEGAEEIDVVISRRHVFSRNWKALYDEICTFREACGGALLKVILATGELKTLRNIQKASLVAMMAGADFIKTSTGKEAINATPATSIAMVRAIRDYHQQSGFSVGFKPAGGISKAKDSLSYLIIMKEELGRRWLERDLFRFGASSLLVDIERQIEHFTTGAYSATYRHPLA